MHTATSSAFGPDPRDARTMNKALTWSIVVHLVLLAAVFVISRRAEEPPKPRMMISLGGTPGPRSTGMSEIGGRTVEEVAPPPRRPEPARPTPPKVENAPVVTRKPPVTAKPVVTDRPQPVTTRPPVTGRQVTQGTTPTDTGVSSTSQGLSFGGNDGTGGLTDLRDFCCPAYLETMRARIDAVWKKAQAASGVNVVRFTVRRDGTVTDIQFEKPSGIGILDRASRSALLDVRLPALPAEYKGDTITVHVTFPYGYGQ